MVRLKGLQSLKAYTKDTKVLAYTLYIIVFLKAWHVDGARARMAGVSFYLLSISYIFIIELERT